MATKATAVPEMSLRDQLRASTVGKRIELKRKIVEWEGKEYELRQPNLRERKRLREKILTDTGVDIFDAMVWLTIWQTYVPGTDERVFDDTDYEIFLNNPSGSFVDNFGSEIVLMSNLDLGEIRGNS